MVLGRAFRGPCGEVFVARLKGKDHRHSSNGDGKTEVVVRDDSTAELFAFPHRDFFCGTGTYGEREPAGERSAAKTARTGRPDQPAVS
ncbi:hypothetical protein ABT346_27880 [Micromonospora peucetia]|uniref:hypothetical protein n=1 Tax=Micromonospora peucetia TaxID=47871 RepID=UPI00331725B7